MHSYVILNMNAIFVINRLFGFLGFQFFRKIEKQVTQVGTNKPWLLHLHLSDEQFTTSLVTTFNLS